MTAVALLLLGAIGALLWSLLDARAGGPGVLCTRLGAGYVLGCLGWGVGLRWVSSDASVAGLFGATAGWLVLLVVASAAVAHLLHRPRAAIGRAPTATTSGAFAPWSWYEIVLLGALVLLGVLILWQAVLLPTVAWDAWNAWQSKAKGWSGADRLLPVVAPLVWTSDPPGSAVASVAAHYPETLPRLMAWLASAVGGWDEAAVHLPWPGLWIALGALLFGLQREAGVARAQSLLVTGFVLALPLVMAHATLAGYADLWVATLLLLVLAQGERWLHLRRWQDAVPFVVTALLLPAVKLEGAVWLLCIAAAWGLAWLPRRLRWLGIGVGALVLGAILLLGGMSLPVPGLGWVELGWGRIVVPGMGELDLFWRPVLAPVLSALFLRENWNLLWYLALPLLWFARTGLRQPSLAGLGMFFVLAFAFQALLFFFTDASRWAENLTSLNRILLQITPAFVYWLSLLWLRREPASNRFDPAAR